MAMIRNEAVTVLRLDNVQHNQAAAQAAQAIGKIGSTGEVSAGQIRAAMRSLPAQFTDVVTQLQGGQSPLTVLIQQGGQVKDQFGGIGNALRGVLAFIGPVGLVAGAVAGIGVAALAAERNARQLYDALALTNNSAGLTADRLREISDRISASSRGSASDAKEAVLALASEGTVSARVLESMALAVQRVADLSGKSVQDVAKDFASMSKGVADWAAEHNKSFNFITAAQYKYIKQLEEQGKAEEAAIFVSRQLAGQLETQVQNLGYLEGAWAGVKKLASEAWTAMLGFGKAETLAQQLDSARAELAKVEGRLADAKNSPLPAGPAGMGEMQREAEMLRQRIANLGEQQRMENRLADSRSANAQRERAAIDKLREKPAASTGEKLKNYNPGGLFVGPEYISPLEDIRRSEIAGTDAVNKALQDASIKRFAAQQKFLGDLVKANEDANVQLIADDQQRAMAQINLERNRLQKQIDEVYGNSPARAEAEAAADAAAQAKRQATAQKFAKDTAVVTREETRDALAAAFRDSKNPIRAFGDALGNIVFQRVSTNLADALLNAAFGSGGGFGGGLLGSLLGSFSSPASLLAGATGFGDYNAVAALAGARAGGGDVMPGEAYLVGERGPEILRMGRQGGTVIPNHAIGGGHQVSIVQHITLGAGVTPAQFAAGMVQAKESAKAEMLQILQRNRAL